MGELRDDGGCGWRRRARKGVRAFAYLLFGQIALLVVSVLVGAPLIVLYRPVIPLVHLFWIPGRFGMWTAGLVVMPIVGILCYSFLGGLIAALDIPGWLRRRRRTGAEGLGPYQFSLSDILLLMLLASILLSPVGWVASRKIREREVVSKLNALGATLKFSWGAVVWVDLDKADLRKVDLSCLKELKSLCVLDLSNTSGTDAALASIQDLSTLEYLGLAGSDVSSKGFAYLKGFTNLETLRATGVQVDDADLAVLADLKQLEFLDLAVCPIGDDGLFHLKKLSKLQRLWLVQTSITDDGLAHLAGLTHLEELDIAETRITDDGLAHLVGLTRLRSLEVSETQVTQKGADKLKRSLRYVYVGGLHLQ